MGGSACLENSKRKGRSASEYSKRGKTRNPASCENAAEKPLNRVLSLLCVTSPAWASHLASVRLARFISTVFLSVRAETGSKTGPAFIRPCREGPKSRKTLSDVERADVLLADRNENRTWKRDSDGTAHLTERPVLLCRIACAIHGSSPGSFSLAPFQRGNVENAAQRICGRFDRCAPKPPRRRRGLLAGLITGRRYNAAG